MRSLSILPFFLILALTSACQRDEETGNAESVVVSDTASQDVLQLAPASANTLPDPTPVPSPVPAPVPATQQPVKPSGKQEALNPPHGQPGHRCEIPVGAPLSSAPKVSQQAPVNTQPAPVTNTMPVNTAPVNMTPAPAPANTVTAPGMNPPHGQPGHRCEIPVGDPLPAE